MIQFLFLRSCIDDLTKILTIESYYEEDVKFFIKLKLFFQISHLNLSLFKKSLCHIEQNPM